MGQLPDDLRKLGAQEIPDDLSKLGAKSLPSDLDELGAKPIEDDAPLKFLRGPIDSAFSFGKGLLGIEDFSESNPNKTSNFIGELIGIGAGTGLGYGLINKLKSNIGLGRNLSGRLDDIGRQIIDPPVIPPQKLLGPAPTRGLELPPASVETNFSWGLPENIVWKGGPSRYGGGMVEAVSSPAIEAQISNMVQQPLLRGPKGKFIPEASIGKPGPYEQPTAGPKLFESTYPKKTGPIIDLTPVEGNNLLFEINRMKKDGELNFNFLHNAEKAVRESKSLPRQEKVKLLNELTNFTKSMMASMDISAPLRQGLPLIHKKEWWTSLDDMFKSLVSEKQYNVLMQTIESKTTYALQQRSGLSLTNLKDVAQREEAYMSKWAEKIPGVRASERAYVGFLNKLRSDTFDSLIANAEKAGREITPELSKGIAKFVNTATGRGSLGSLEKAAVELNYALFSPRLISSRLTMLNPVYYVKADPLVRKEALKSLLAIATAGGMVTEMGRMAGGEVINDSNSPDFRKVKVGNVRIDPYGGFQQYIVAASKLITGKATSSTTGKTWNMGESFVAPTRLSTVANFGRNKLSPAFSFAADLLAGKDATGKPFSTPKAIADRFTPMLLNDLKKLYDEDPSLLPLGLGAALGMGMQVYDK